MAKKITLELSFADIMELGVILDFAKMFTIEKLAKWKKKPNDNLKKIVIDDYEAKRKFIKKWEQLYLQMKQG